MIRKFIYLVPEDFDNPCNPKTEFFIINELIKNKLEIITLKKFNSELIEKEKNLNGIIFSSLKVIWREIAIIKYAKKKSIDLFWWYFDTASTSIRRKYKVKKIAKNVDIFFNKDLLKFKSYIKHGINPVWLDQGVPNLCKKNNKKNYKFDVSFFGSFEKTHSKRLKILNEINKNFDLVIYTKDTKKFTSNGFKNVRDFISPQSISMNIAKINLILHGNYNADYCWSNRIHLIIGSSGFALVEKIKGLDKFYKNNEHCIFFNPGDLNKSLKYWLDTNQDEAREKIRISGFNQAHNNNSYNIKASLFIKTITQFSKNEKKHINYTP